MYFRSLFEINFTKNNIIPTDFNYRSNNIYFFIIFQKIIKLLEKYSKDFLKDFINYFGIN